VKDDSARYVIVQL